jgi:hypothetical protein
VIDRFKSIVQEDVEEFIKTGKMAKAIRLTELTEQHFNHNEDPLYFTGDLAAKLVLVHLNPKQADNKAATGRSNHPNFASYWQHCRNFGKRAYGVDSPRTHRSPFDKKQIEFLRPFGLIDFKEGVNDEEVFWNLERVVDHKLQLELIPYGSNKFSGRGFKPKILQSHRDRIFALISAYPREYVIFCGRIFDGLLDGESEPKAFRLQKKDGSQTGSNYAFSVKVLTHRNCTVKVGIAHSFARQGLTGELMRQYGQECKRIYDQHVV